ncbi:MAG: PIN domain-containing protein, partial [Solirubrobacterales bacterium]|nr:PIN domain-containing protein [Solirubrobacterales bacterium]
MGLQLRERKDLTSKRTSERPERLSAFLDTDVLIRHLTGEPLEMAARATAALAAAGELLLADLVVAECVYVLESFYEVDRARVAELMRAAIALPSIRTVDSASLRRALEVYEVERLDFAEAYLVRRRRPPASAASCPSTSRSTGSPRSGGKSREADRSQPSPDTTLVIHVRCA